MDCRYFHEPSSCQGDLGFDDSCTRCTALGNCPVGEYFDAAFCDGTGTTDDQCQPCTVSGSCPSGQFFDSTKCLGDGSTDDSCQDCTADGNCDSGYALPSVVFCCYCCRCCHPGFCIPSAKISAFFASTSADTSSMRHCALDLAHQTTHASHVRLVGFVRPASTLTARSAQGTAHPTTRASCARRQGTARWART